MGFLVCFRFSSFLLLTIVLPTRALAQAGTIEQQPQEIIDFLNRTIDWYQGEIANAQIANTPSDRFFFDSNRATANQIAHLSFEFARNSAGPANNGHQMVNGNVPALHPHYSEFVQQIHDLEVACRQKKAELASLQDKLRRARAVQRKTIEAAISNSQGELKLLEARQEIFNTILRFIQGAASPDSVQAQIDALERAIPPTQATAETSTANTTPTVKPTVVRDAFGIWGTIRNLMTASKKIQAINQSMRRTNRLSEDVEQLFGPVRKEMDDLVRISEDASVPQSTQTDLAQQQSKLDASANRFKQISAMALPLSKQGILLRGYTKNLQNWHAAVRADYASMLKSLMIRVLILGLILAIVVSIFVLWRRAIVHYVGDLRKRYQYLVLRRIAFTFVILLMIISTFISALGSLATFAGLLTAGVAVALQNVILAVVGYFMLIGKFGVSAGDRVQVADVVGEVAEISMLRIFILEFTGKDADAQPTGRIVAFSNSVVFQLNAGLFKQVPGTSLVWREFSLTFAPENNYRSIEQRIFTAVDNAFSEYRTNVDRVRRRMQSVLTSISIRSLEPQVRFQVTPSGTKVWIRLPLELEHVADLDNRIAKELMFAIEQEPKLKILEAESPNLRRRLDISRAISEEESAKESIS
jgi:small-conductance mechanosensitive channel